MTELGKVVGEERESESAIKRTHPILSEIIGGRDLIEKKFLRPLPQKPAAYLVYSPPDKAFSVVSMVWSPGQAFPIHDHLAWGLIGVLRNQVNETRYRRIDDGTKEDYAEIREIGVKDFVEGEILEEGLVFDPVHRDDIHRIRNASSEPSVSIHILATDLGTKQRHQYDLAKKRVEPFVSGYDAPQG